MKLKIWEISLIAALVISILSGFAMANDQKELSEKLIRLHVVANSDSEEDQNLKLDVRDQILSELAIILNGVTDRDIAETLIEENLSLLEKSCVEEITKQGYDYGVKATITVESFPTREYETFSLPAGDYVSLRVIIGTGEGHNWWCVVFPPICTTAATENDLEVMNLTDDEISLITEESTGYIIKFKAIEFFEKVISFFK